MVALTSQSTTVQTGANFNKALNLTAGKKLRLEAIVDWWPPQVFAVKFRARPILTAAGYISAAAITRWAGKTQILSLIHISEPTRPY